MRVVQPVPTTQTLTSELVADRDLIEAFGAVIIRDGDVHEMRIPKPRRGGPNRLFGVASGYVDSPDALADALEDLTGHDAQGVYLTLNPTQQALFARAANRLETHGKLATTTDAQIVSRRHVVLDFDSIRPTDISATDAERDLAMVRMDEAVLLLGDLGWPPPVVTMMTGNGGAAIYRVNLPNDDGARELVEQVLAGAVVLFGGGGVEVDTTMANASRIFKVAGTVAAKGDSIPERPWRLATAAFQPDAMPVALVALETVAQIGRQTSSPRTSPKGSTSSIANGASRPGEPIADRVPGLLAAAGVGYEVKARGGVTVYQLERCLTSDDHTDGAAILALPSGAVAYRCHHNRCRDKGWADARASLGLEPTAPAGISFTVGTPATRTAAAKPTPEERADRLDASLAAGFQPAPANCFYGWFGDYARLMGPTSEAPDEFHLGASLALAAAMVGRSISVDYVSETLYPNLYIGLIGQSGSSRKDTAIKRATTLPTTNYAFNSFEAPRFRMVRDMSSAQGLIAIFKDSPNVLMYLSELSALIKNARRKSTSTILDALIEVWDTPPTLQNNTKTDPTVAVNQIMSIIAATQPGRLANEITDEDIHSGFANRWLFITGTGKPPMARPPSLDKQSAWSAYTDLRDAIQSLDQRSLTVDPDAGTRFDDWYIQTTGATGLDEAESAMRQRHATIAMKVASLFAISDGVRAITERHLSAAIALVEWSWSEIRPLLAEWGVGIDQRIEAAIVRCLTRSPRMKRRDVQSSTKQKTFTARDFATTFESMLRNGTISIDGEGYAYLDRD